jgi:hypothetical protein
MYTCSNHEVIMNNHNQPRSQTTYIKRAREALFALSDNRAITTAYTILCDRPQTTEEDLEHLSSLLGRAAAEIDSLCDVLADCQRANTCNPETHPDKSDWPEWLREADTNNACVTISENGSVVWYDGVWHDGVWRGGDWYGGLWRGGIWDDGIWHDGVWRGGIWRGGLWYGGDWYGGDSTPSRCVYRVRGSGDTIKVGCWSGSIEEAKALTKSGDLPDDAPDRDSEEGRLLRASVLAQIAYQEALL